MRYLRPRTPHWCGPVWTHSPSRNKIKSGRGGTPVDPWQASRHSVCLWIPSIRWAVLVGHQRNAWDENHGLEQHGTWPGVPTQCSAGQCTPQRLEGKQGSQRRSNERDLEQKGSQHRMTGDGALGSNPTSSFHFFTPPPHTHPFTWPWNRVNTFLKSWML